MSYRETPRLSVLKRGRLLGGTYRLGLASALCLVLQLNIAPRLASQALAREDSSIDANSLFLTKADPLLQIIQRAAIVEDGFSTQPKPASNPELKALAKMAGVETVGDGRTRVSLTITLANDDDSELKAAGFALGARLGRLATIETEVSRLPELAALASVRKLTAATRAYPNNDLSRRSIGVDDAFGQRVVSQTGRGVIVAIIDDGIDFRHLDFTLPGTNGQQTRIKALLDMTVYNAQSPPLPPDPNWNYVLPGASGQIGRLYTESDINAALRGQGNIPERNLTGHGTHVAGTAAGNGLAGPVPGKYSGMAPEADVIIVKASRQNDGTDNFLDADQINALAFIQQKASEMGEPFVVNMSMAGHFGPHDGSRGNERAIDEIVNGGPGRAVCISGGSTGDMHAHASGNLTNNGDINLRINVREATQFLWLSYSKTDNVTVNVTRADGIKSASVAYNANLAPGLSNQYIDIYNTLDDKRDTDPLNDQKAIILVLKPGATALGASPHTWTFTLHGDSVTDGHFDAWASLEGDFISNIDDSSQTTVPGTSRGGITVGGYVTRGGDRAIGDYASFSSQGPTADGRLKPDISAPAFTIFSSKAAGSLYFNSPLAPDSNSHVGAYGNSFATPAVTGAVALLLQANPRLTSPQIKEIIKNTATHDLFTGGAIWHERFGFGKLNVASGLNSIPASGNSNDDARFFVRQHYLDFLNRVADQSGADFWANEISLCGADVACLEVKRINVSAAFFLSIEFQQTGYLVYRIYKTSYGNLPGGAPVPVRLGEFTPDMKEIGQNVVVGQSGWEQIIENNKRAFTEEFVQRSRFAAAYPVAMTPLQFVETLNANAGNPLSAAERDQLIGELASGAKTRAQVLRAVAEDPEVYSAEFNRAFVLMQYFGYMQRNPDDFPEPTRDFQGYNFWLGKLNAFNGNFVNAEMVKAFISSSEYRTRFGL